jgi:hypothetical protein
MSKGLRILAIIIAAMMLLGTVVTIFAAML